MASDIYCYAYAEDAPSVEVIRQIIAYVNRKTPAQIVFHPGFPSVVRGSGNLKKTAKKFIAAAKNGLHVIIVSDLDTYGHPNDIGREWLGIECLSDLPETFFFRIAVREIESWIMADIDNFSDFMEVPVGNLLTYPDDEADPKEFLFNLIRRKCRKKWQRDMLPLPGQVCGIAYNPRMCAFVSSAWNIENAMNRSTSLKRAVERISAYLQGYVTPNEC